MKDEKIDSLLKEIYEVGKYRMLGAQSFINDNDAYIEYERLLIQEIYKEHKLVLDPYRGHFYLSDRGKEISEKGGWLVHLQDEKRKKKREESKEQFDFEFSRARAKTFWWLFGFAVFGGAYSVYDLISNLTKSKSEPQEQTPKEETESELFKQHTLLLTQKNLDSLRNSKIPSDTLNN